MTAARAPRPSQRREATQPVAPDSTESAWALIAGGGTAGHMLPGISIAAEITNRGVPACAVHFVGSARGVESRMVPEAGFALTLLPGRGLQRKVTLQNAASLTGLARAFLRSLRVIRDLRPAVVVGLGGYASLACGAAAVVARVPLVITEQNVVAGLANRLLSRFAAAAATAFESCELPRACWTGNPVRAEVLAVDRNRRNTARTAMGVTEQRRQLVAVFGGSLGARRINHASIDAMGIWRQRSDLHIRHVAGNRDHAALQETQMPGPDDALRYDLVDYERDMATMYTGADLVVCRAGATTIAELAATGVPAILVPLPNAPGDHQNANARELAAAGAAVIVADDELDGARLAREVDALLGNPDRLEVMSAAARRLARPDATQRVVDLVERCARRPRPQATHSAL